VPRGCNAEEDSAGETGEINHTSEEDDDDDDDDDNQPPTYIK